MSDPCIRWQCGHDRAAHDGDDGCRDCLEQGEECLSYADEPSEAQLEAMAVGYSARERWISASAEKRALHGRG